MVALRNLGAITASLLFILIAGCATMQGSLASSADKLERNADVLARDARMDSSGGYSRDYSSDARQLAEQAHDFRQTVDDRRSDERDVHRAFEELSRDYHALRDEIDRTDSRAAQADFRPVTEAYLDIEREMSKHPDNRRYARERDRDARDRY
jgi:outer membrane murein-binding lipoprotein Lpp